MNIIIVSQFNGKMSNFIKLLPYTLNNAYPKDYWTKIEIVVEFERLS